MLVETAPRLKDLQFERSGNKVRVISLFSGCGGMDLGIEAAGGEIVYANDILPSACKTLRENFSDCDVVEGDVSRITTFPSADVVVGGYPCQSFSMAGNRTPNRDHRSDLYKQFLRVVNLTRPKYFVAENVSGLKQLGSGAFLREQIRAFSEQGYAVFYQVLNAAEYGVPQNRRRLFIVGIQKSLGQKFSFPAPTHGNPSTDPTLLPFVSHGDTIRGMPLWPDGEFYERPHDPDGHFSWYYMSRRRKANWDAPSYTIVANWRHVTLHPASPSMQLTWSDLKNGWKQRWDFTSDYEHLSTDRTRPVLDQPRRLSWRECALIQTFPESFEPFGEVEDKFIQIGNAVPPLLAYSLFNHLLSGSGLRPGVRRAARTSE